MIAIKVAVCFAAFYSKEELLGGHRVGRHRGYFYVTNFYNTN
jgi:hypothetical protein